jgi:hypothetical protein
LTPPFTARAQFWGGSCIDRVEDLRTALKKAPEDGELNINICSGCVLRCGLAASAQLLATQPAA